jgi:hypothetical protein
VVKTIELPVEKTPVKEPEPIGGDGPEFCGPHIRCPLCRWRPRKTDRWMCKCRHIWNTFDTGGVCPSCLFQWLQTQCLACKKFSPHSDWYETE